MEKNLSDLIAALEIFKSYEDNGSLLGFEQETIYVYISPDVVSEVDKKRLEELGFEPTDGDPDYEDTFISMSYGL